MLERASGQFIIEGNVEDIFGGIEGMARIARISQTCRFSGTLEGESIAEYTAVLPRDGDSSFQGFQRISGKIGEREGSFVVGVTGDYFKSQPRGTWTIVPKSGSGDFAHIRGGGAFSQSAGKPGTYTFEFDLRKPRKARSASQSQTTDSAELVPGIDIALEETAAAPLIDVALEVPVTATPKRHRTAAAKAAPVPIVEAAADIIEPPAAKPNRRTRKTATVEATVPTPPAPVATSPAKRARKSSPPMKLDEEPIAATTPTKRTRKQTESAAAVPPRRQTISPVSDQLPLPAADASPLRQRRSKAA